MMTFLETGDYGQSTALTLRTMQQRTENTQERKEGLLSVLRA